MDGREASSTRVFLLLILSFAGLTALSGLRFIHNLDWNILRFFHGTGTPLARYGLALFIVPGSLEISVSCLFLLSIWFYRKGDTKRAYWILAAFLIVTVAEHGIKQTFLYPTIPDAYKGRFPFIPLVGSTRVETPSSFPSGHCLRTLLVLGIVFLWFCKGIVRLTFGWLILFFLIMQVVAMNYYGFHWTRDCLGGYHLGIVVLYGFDRYFHHELR